MPLGGKGTAGEDGNRAEMKLEEARQILGLGILATRREIRDAYRRAARRWHPDRAPAGAEDEYRRRMQEVNAAYQRLKEFLEHYRYRLEEGEEEGDVARWWRERFNVGVWSGPNRQEGQ